MVKCAVEVGQQPLPRDALAFSACTADLVIQSGDVLRIQDNTCIIITSLSAQS